MGPSHSDFTSLSQRVAQLEDFQNQTLIFLLLVTFLAGLALGFIWAKYFHKDESKKQFKW